MIKDGLAFLGGVLFATLFLWLLGWDFERGVVAAWYLIVCIFCGAACVSLMHLDEL